jgi:hypothetical protein
MVDGAISPWWRPVPSLIHGGTITPWWRPVPSLIHGGTITPWWRPVPSLIQGGTITPWWRPVPSLIHGGTITPWWRSVPSLVRWWAVTTGAIVSGTVVAVPALARLLGGGAVTTRTVLALGCRGRAVTTGTVLAGSVLAGSDRTRLGRPVTPKATALGVTDTPTAPTVATDGAVLGVDGLLEGAALVVLEQGQPAVAETQQPGIEPREVLGDVLQVPLEQFLRLAVGGGVDDLGQVDEGGAAGGDEDVEGREVAVDHAARQQQADLAVNLAVQELGDVGGQLEVRQTGGGAVLVVDEELHQQHVFVQQDGLGDPHAGGAGGAQGLELHVPPVLLDELAAIAGAFAHGPLVPGIARLVAPLGVAGGGLEGPLLPILVDLGRDELALPFDNEDRGLLAAHQASVNLIDDAVIDQLLQGVGFRHGLPRGAVGPRAMDWTTERPSCPTDAATSSVVTHRIQQGLTA